MLTLDAAKTLYTMRPHANKSTCHDIKSLFQILMVPLSPLTSTITIFPLKLITAGVMLFLYYGLSPTPALASKYAAIVIEELSGKVLFSRNADHLRYPASLTKIMTLYLLFEDIEAGRITLNSRIPVSKKAAGR